MDKNAIKTFAMTARAELKRRVAQRARDFEITADACADADRGYVNGRPMTDEEIVGRRALVRKITRDGFEQTVEEVAYLWFNRFIALRYMEVNGYLPIRVFTSREEDKFEPEILADAISLDPADLPGLDRGKVFKFKENDDEDGLYKYLLVVQCNALAETLPGLFQKIEDYSEFLCPDGLLHEENALRALVEDIPPEDWKDQVQIIGWLYQYYNTELKASVDADKKKVKVTKETLPAVTQLFTPDWIVRYMVENSLGRLWLDGHPDAGMQKEWRYYLEEAEQTPEVQAQLASIREENARLRPEEIRVIDPCMGSGHILVAMFDVLMQIYRSSGYSDRDAVSSIVSRNLYGLDIDDRASQLAYFAVMMKARSYDSRFLSRGIGPQVYAIAESNGLDDAALDYFENKDPALKKNVESLVDALRDAKEYGSLLAMPELDFPALYARIEEIRADSHLLRDEVLNKFPPLIQVAEVLAQKYRVVCTNPPYMGASYMDAKLGGFVKKMYPDSKGDLFACFIERCQRLTADNYYQAMVTQHSWMFLSSYEKLRVKLQNVDLVNMAHLGARAFEEIGGEVVQTTSFVMRMSRIAGYKGAYCRLIEPSTQQGKEEMFLSGKGRYVADQSNFSKIPGAPVAYWASDKLRKAFENDLLYNHSVSPSQNVTGNNAKFVRKHWEIVNHKIGGKDSWIFYAKGGGFRKWWGNLEDVINWTPEARKIYHFGDGKHASQIINKDYWYQKGITWGLISSAPPSFRIMPEGATYDKGGSTIIVDEDAYSFTLALLNSNVYLNIVSMLNPTLNFQVKDVRLMPLVLESKEVISCKVVECVKASKADWDSYETSWDFKRHPLVPCRESLGSGLLSTYYETWKGECEKRFEQLKANEEELNRIFIDVYGLREELTPEVAEKDVTVHRVYDSRDAVPESMKGNAYVRTKRDEVVSLISYSVGCMFGRYSLDAEGLAYAGGDWDAGKYPTFPADDDNVIPVCDDDYFEDDVTTRFIQWVRVVYGESTLEENLKFIASALGGKGFARDVIRAYFLTEFYNDHVKTYQKRPIYWLFDSGKKNGFKALVYLHRYTPDTLARMRTSYVHRRQGRYHAELEELRRRIDSPETPELEKIKLGKRQAVLKAQAEELRIYEEKIHHLADLAHEVNLDDGVKVNYAKFGDALAKIR